MRPARSGRCHFSQSWCNRLHMVAAVTGAIRMIDQVAGDGEWPHADYVECCCVVEQMVATKLELQLPAAAPGDEFDTRQSLYPRMP